MSAKHTSGPWSVIRKDKDTIYIALTPDAVGRAKSSYGWLHHHLFCLAGTGFDDPKFADKHMPEVEANARLISAAPDLLEALEVLVKANEEWNAVVEQLIGRPANWTDEYLNTARAAIAKAKGKS